MKFRLRKASDWDFDQEIEVSTLEELKAIQDTHGSDLIVDFSDRLGAGPRVLIYDDYVE